jgi:hypothetical protein
MLREIPLNYRFSRLPAKQFESSLDLPYGCQRGYDSTNAKNLIINDYERGIAASKGRAAHHRPLMPIIMMFPATESMQFGPRETRRQCAAAGGYAATR